MSLPGRRPGVVSPWRTTATNPNCWPDGWAHWRLALQVRVSRFVKPRSVLKKMSNPPGARLPAESMSTNSCGGAGWTERIALALDPPSKHVIVIWNAPPTSLVPTVNVALLELAATVTDVGRVRTLFVSLLDNWTTAPPPGAAPDSVTVP